MKNEIDAKFNNMIKLFINDIRPFLENIEELTNERKKLKDLENREREIELLREKLNEKITNEHKMKSDLDFLKKENTDLKSKMKNKRKNVTFKVNKSREKNYYDSNKSYSKMEESKSFTKAAPYFKTLSSIQKTSRKNIRKKITPYTVKEEKIRTSKKESNKSIERRIYRKNCIGNIIPKPKIKSGSVEKRKVFNPNLLTDSPINKKKKFVTIQSQDFDSKINTKKKLLKMGAKTEDISDDNIELDDYEAIKFENTKQKSEFDFKLTEEASDSMNEDVIDEEIKELEMDEENIKKLIEDIKDFQNDIEIENVKVD